MYFICVNYSYPYLIIFNFLNKKSKLKKSGEFFKKFLVYTNRLNAADWLGLFEKYGFKIISAKMYDDNDNLIDADISFDKLLHKIANIHLIAKKL